LQAHPAVLLCAAIGSPDPYAGEVPVAYVQLRPGMESTAEQLLDFAKLNIHEKAAVPKRIVQLPELPLTAVGKIFKPALTKLEIEHVIRTEAHRLNVQFERLEVKQEKSKGFMAHIYMSSSHTAFQKSLGQYTFLTDWIIRK
jgi:fatty-acyl-CoA synthase